MRIQSLTLMQLIVLIIFPKMHFFSFDKGTAFLQHDISHVSFQFASTFEAVRGGKLLSLHIGFQTLYSLKNFVGEKYKCGSEAKEVEFLKSLHCVCLTF